MFAEEISTSHLFDAGMVLYFADDQLVQKEEKKEAVINLKTFFSKSRLSILVVQLGLVE